MYTLLVFESPSIHKNICLKSIKTIHGSNLMFLLTVNSNQTLVHCYFDSAISTQALLILCNNFLGCIFPMK